MMNSRFNAKPRGTRPIIVDGQITSTLIRNFVNVFLVAKCYEQQLPDQPLFPTSVPGHVPTFGTIWRCVWIAG